MQAKFNRSEEQESFVDAIMAFASSIIFVGIGSLFLLLVSVGGGY
ncbi:hypothetical protein [Photobacterium profundum]|nr:hypothetical protein [Photobacterium profundum]